MGSARDSGRDRRALLRAMCGRSADSYSRQRWAEGQVLRPCCTVRRIYYGGRDNTGRVGRFLGLVAPLGGWWDRLVWGR